jgi:shikimate dehydrogenase
VLLLGAGGATRGVRCCPSRAGAARILVANRTADKAHDLAHELAPHLGGVALAGAGLDALAGAGAFDVVVNATSASLGGQAPAVPASAFAPGALAYDMVYGKGLTPFLALARPPARARGRRPGHAGRAGGRVLRAVARRAARHARGAGALAVPLG